MGDSRRARRFVVAVTTTIAAVATALVAAAPASADELAGVPFTTGGVQYRIATSGSSETLQQASGSAWTTVAPLPAHPADIVAFGSGLYLEAGYSTAGTPTQGSLYELSAGSFVAVPGAPSDVRGDFVWSGALYLRSGAGWTRTTDATTFTPVADVPNDPQSPVKFGGDLYFSANSGTGGASQFWRYKSTTFDLVAGAPTGIAAAAVAGSSLYVRGGTPNALWSFDGTTFTSVGSGAAIVAGPVALHDHVYVGVKDGTNADLERFSGSALTRVGTMTGVGALTVNGHWLYYASSATASTWHGYEEPVTAGTDSVSGTAVVTHVLAVATSGWQAGAAFSYQWARAGKAINGATHSSYTLTAADRGKVMQVTVTGRASEYAASSIVTRTGAVAAARLTTTPTPTVTGTYSIGKTLTAHAGTWLPSPVALHYQWRRSGKAIPGATKSTYKLAVADGAHPIGVTVSGTLAGYTSVARTSPTKLVPGRLTSTPTPSIAGTRRAGSTLTADAGVWGPGTVRLHFQWKRDGSAIKNATGSSYKLTTADIDASISVAVTGTRTNYTTVKKSRSAGTIRHAVDPQYATCKAAEAAGAHTPYYQGVDPEYYWYDDRDHDGIVCE